MGCCTRQETLGECSGNWNSAASWGSEHGQRGDGNAAACLPSEMGRRASHARAVAGAGGWRVGQAMSPKWLGEGRRV